MNIFRKLFVGCIFLNVFIFPRLVLAEEITHFMASYEIQKAGTVQVEERIQYDFGSAIKHGIYRYIPLVTTNAEGKKFKLAVSDIAVIDQMGKPYTFTDSSTDTQVTLKIGDADKTISGEHVYRITYIVSGAVTYFSDHDEFYWNVTGNGWVVPIQKASGTVRLPQTLPETDIKMNCFTGVAGSSNHSCGSVYIQGAATMSAASSLGISEGLTIAVSFPKNIVDVLEPVPVIEKVLTPWEKFVAQATVIGMILAGILWYFGLPIYIILRWVRLGRDPKPVIGVASAWFEPPKTKSGRLLSPGETGTLVDETAGMQDVTATIIDLARRGYIKIVEKKKDDFTFIKQKDYTGDKELRLHETTVLDGIFSGGAREVRIKDKDVSGVVSTVKSNLYTAVVTEKYFDKNPNTTRIIFYVLAGVGLFTGNILLAIVAFLFGRAMPKKTQTGADAAAVAISLKNFLSSQERWLAGIAKNQLMFEKLLPYAIAFGVEKIWARRFKDIAMREPDWYQGYGSHAFTSIYMANALVSTHSSFVRAATPTSSTTGHSSGFSGGFSGGGGGGGGGGSW